MRYNRLKRNKFRSNDRGFRRNGSQDLGTGGINSTSKNFQRPFFGRNGLKAEKLLEKYNGLAKEALSKIDFMLYLNTTLNQGHFLGRGKTTLILPVLARDEEPEPTTQESMFSFVRLSEGGPSRYPGSKSEVKIIAEIAEKVLTNDPFPWGEYKKTGNIRHLIGDVIPGFEKIKEIDNSRKEFHIEGRILHNPEFSTSMSKAKFKVCPIPAVRENSQNRSILMTVRS